MYFLNCGLHYSFRMHTILPLGKTQWTALVTGRYMITMMVLLCYVTLSGTYVSRMYSNCIVIRTIHY